MTEIVAAEQGALDLPEVWGLGKAGHYVLGFDAGLHEQMLRAEIARYRRWSALKQADPAQFKVAVEAAAESRATIYNGVRAVDHFTDEEIVGLGSLHQAFASLRIERYTELPESDPGDSTIVDETSSELGSDLDAPPLVGIARYTDERATQDAEPDREVICKYCLDLSGQDCPHHSTPQGDDAPPQHPAKYPDDIHTAVFAAALDGFRRVLDPFAGTGRIHRLAELGDWETVGVELEPEWAAMHPDTIVGSALDLPFEDSTFDAIATSPAYGNRMADHHNARDDSPRHTYRHTLGRPLHPDNSGQLQWGERYCLFHLEAWAEAVRVLRPGGRFVLNVKDHIRAGGLQGVPAWHHETLTDLGLRLGTVLAVAADGQRHGKNAALRAGNAEPVFVYWLDDE